MRLQQDSSAYGHGILILKGEYHEGTVSWGWAGFLFEELVRSHFPSATPVLQLLAVTVAKADEVPTAVPKACCFSTACCACRTTNRCARGDGGLFCPECVLNACADCSQAECHDPQCPGCDQG